MKACAHMKYKNVHMRYTKASNKLYCTPNRKNPFEITNQNILHLTFVECIFARFETHFCQVKMECKSNCMDAVNSQQGSIRLITNDFHLLSSRLLIINHNHLHKKAD